MRLVEGLNKYEAVKVGDLYVVQLKDNNYSSGGTHLVGGISTTVGQIVSSTLEVYQIKKPEKVTEYYKDDSGNTISVEDYRKVISGNEPFFDCDSQTYVYPDLETEFNIRKKIDELKDFYPVVKEVKEDPVKVDIKLIGEMLDTGSSYIECSINFGAASFKEGGYIYKVSPSFDIAVNELSVVANSSPEDLIELPNHSKLRYLKVNSKYIFNTELPLGLSCSPRLFTNLDEAKEYEEKIRSEVRRYVQPYLKKNQDTNRINSVDVSDLLLKLEKVKTLTCHKRCEQQKAHLIEDINKFRGKFLDSMENLK